MENYEYKYFIILDDKKYITGMFISFSEEDEAWIRTGKEIEIDKDAYGSIGPNSQYIDGKVVQGEPQTPVLTPDAVASIRDSRVAYATTKISILTDSTDPDLVDEVDQADVALLKKWKQYRIALTKIDLNNPAWPEMPE